MAEPETEASRHGAQQAGKPESPLLEPRIPIDQRCDVLKAKYISFFFFPVYFRPHGVCGYSCMVRWVLTIHRSHSHRDATPFSSPFLSLAACLSVGRPSSCLPIILGLCASPAEAVYVFVPPRTPFVKVAFLCRCLPSSAAKCFCPLDRVTGMPLTVIADK